MGFSTQGTEGISLCLPSCHFIQVIDGNNKEERRRHSPVIYLVCVQQNGERTYTKFRRHEYCSWERVDMNVVCEYGGNPFSLFVLYFW